jgi:hypothetical protein
MIAMILQKSALCIQLYHINLSPSCARASYQVEVFAGSWGLSESASITDALHDALQNQQGRYSSNASTIYAVDLVVNSIQVIAVGIVD